MCRLSSTSSNSHQPRPNNLRFYAPWCGHCQKLAPAYEKAAKSLKGLAKIASVNCDEAPNKPLCERFQIQGFPTLKIVRPSKKSGQPTVEDYQGARSAKAIVDAVVEKIPNHVKRVTDNSLESWLNEKNGTAKAILFTEKGTVSALLRALAIDYLGVVNVGQVRSKEAAAVGAFGVDKFPSLMLLPGGDKEPVVYQGELKKEPMSEFLSQAGPPNPDPAPEAPKKEKKAAKKDKPAEKKAEEAKEEEPAEEAAKPSAEPPKPKPAPVVPTIDEADLRQRCLSETSKICALLLLPTAGEPQEAAQEALRTVALVYDKHSKRHASFPFFAVAPTRPPGRDPARGLEARGRVAAGHRREREEDVVAAVPRRGVRVRCGRGVGGRDQDERGQEGGPTGEPGPEGGGEVRGRRARARRAVRLLWATVYQHVFLAICFNGFLSAWGVGVECQGALKILLSYRLLAIRPCQ